MGQRRTGRFDFLHNSAVGQGTSFLILRKSVLEGARAEAGISVSRVFHIHTGVLLISLSRTTQGHILARTYRLAYGASAAALIVC